MIYFVLHILFFHGEIHKQYPFSLLLLVHPRFLVGLVLPDL
jgi:hypothetical protein